MSAHFRPVASGAQDLGKSHENVAASALGVSAAKRQIAVRLGVDPYTDFQPLAQALREAAHMTALGKLAIDAALMAIAGTAGVCLSHGKTGQNVVEMARGKTSSELRDMNRAKLAEMKISAKAISAFLEHASYTSTDQTMW